MGEAQALILQLQFQLKEAEEIRKKIIKEKEENEMRTQELAIERVMTVERVDELERREIELLRDLDAVRAENVNVEEKANSILEKNDNILFFCIIIFLIFFLLSKKWRARFRSYLKKMKSWLESSLV